MSKNNKLHENLKKEAFNTRAVFIKNAKRYGIVLLFSVPVILVISYVLNLNVSWYKGAVSFFFSFAMLLVACLIGLVVFTKKDDKRRKDYDYEKERDPFSD